MTCCEIRLDGCCYIGDGEECACLYAAGAAIACPDVTILEDEAGNSDCDGSAELQSLGQALEQLTYLALERHHPGWEINDGACGELVIDVAEATFVQIGRAHVRTPVTNAHLVCRLLLEQKKLSPHTAHLKTQSDVSTQKTII